MKKKIMSVVMSIVMLLMCCGLVGCDSMIVLQFESDWRFKYYYDETRDGYIIVGTELFGYSDPMYIPAYYKGKPIIATGYFKPGYMGGGTNYSIDCGSAKKVYYPFGVEERHHLSENRENYIVSTTGGFSYSTLGSNTNVNTIFYLSDLMFDRIHEEIIWCSLDTNKNPALKYEKLSSTRFGFHYYFREDPMIIVQRANTSYMFNYDGAPNNGYFFINHYNEGDIIKNTPYKPMREGYIFDGWYKEPECINVVNFKKDIVLDEEKETKLYAKWREKNFLGF